MTRDLMEPTRKQRRAQSRTRRRELEAAQAAAALRHTRLSQLGGVTGIVVVIIAVILVATGTGGGRKAVVAHSRAADAAVAAATSVLRGIPQRGNVLGDQNAPVTLQYYADLECPVCRQFSTGGALPAIIQRWVRPGRLKVEYLALETATREPEVFRDQQVAALAAGRQNRMWQYVELFYNEQGEEGSGFVTERYLGNLAEQVPGLNVRQWSAARTDPALADRLIIDAQAASSVGLNGTPSFLVGRTGAGLKTIEYSSLNDPAPFNAAIEQSLKG
jgi:protein-disulfide isomerase